MLSVAALTAALDALVSPGAVHGEGPALNRSIASVDRIASAEEASLQRRDSLVFVPPDVARCGDISLDIVIRRAGAVGVSCLVVDSLLEDVPLSTLELASQFRIALWCEPYSHHTDLRSRIDSLIRDPDLVGVEAIRLLAEVLQQPNADIGDIVQRLSEYLGTPTALVGTNGYVIAGAQLAQPDELAAVCKSAERTGTTNAEPYDVGEDARIILVTAFPLIAENPRYWLAAVAPFGRDSRFGHVATSLRIASLALSARLAATSLSYERDNRETGTVLESIIRRGDRPSLADVELATAFGWKLFGWHTAVQVRAETSLTQVPAPTLARSLTGALADQGFVVRLIEYARALVFWVTFPAKPDRAAEEGLLTRLKLAFSAVERLYPGVRLRAGVGSALEGPGGIAGSMEDARHALVFAGSLSGRSVVHRSESMTATRLIRNWVPEGPERDVLTSVLAPLQDADPTGQLESTLRTYLDLESNASQTSTALGLHRNTVLQRLATIRRLIELDLDEPTDRLVLRLALRFGAG